MAAKNSWIKIVVVGVVLLVVGAMFFRYDCPAVHPCGVNGECPIVPPCGPNGECPIVPPCFPQKICPITPICPPCNPGQCKHTGVMKIGSMQWANGGQTIQPIKLFNVSGFKFDPNSVGGDISVAFPLQGTDPMSITLNQQSPFSGKINTVDVGGNTITVVLPRIYRYLPHNDASANVNATAFIY